MTEIRFNIPERVLVAYYSYSGNTRVVAEQIKQQTGADIFEIQVANDYPLVYNKLLAQAKKEIRTGQTPLLKEGISNFDNYDVIFIGYPNWCNTYPAPVLSFLSGYNFSGKIIAPFCTHGGGGIGHSFTDIAKQVPDSTILNGFSINGYSVKNGAVEVNKWLSNIQNKNKSNIKITNHEKF